MRGIAAEQPGFLVLGQEPEPLLRGPLGPAKLWGFEPLDSRSIVEGGLEHGPEPLNRRRSKTDTSDLLEPAPAFRGLGNRVITGNVVDLVESPKVVRLQAAGPVHVDEPGVGDRQHLGFAAVAVQQGLPDVVFEPGSVGLCILAAIAARRVLFDPAGFATETDRATDVVRPGLVSAG